MSMFSPELSDTRILIFIMNFTVMCLVQVNEGSSWRSRHQARRICMVTFRKRYLISKSPIWNHRGSPNITLFPSIFQLGDFAKGPLSAGLGIESPGSNNLDG